mmetsp:Transcript_4146/g.11811  ORF Transcript_4146/g.11811 Transcript_4146/m.11811 type:complete len:385 (+) Transcript_4146:1066-2220(+)
MCWCRKRLCKVSSRCNDDACPFLLMFALAMSFSASFSDVSIFVAEKTLPKLPWPRTDSTTQGPNRVPVSTSAGRPRSILGKSWNKRSAACQKSPEACSSSQSFNFLASRVSASLFIRARKRLLLASRRSCLQMAIETANLNSHADLVLQRTSLAPLAAKLCCTDSTYSLSRAAAPLTSDNNTKMGIATNPLERRLSKYSVVARSRPLACTTMSASASPSASGCSGTSARIQANLQPRSQAMLESSSLLTTVTSSAWAVIGGSSKSFEAVWAAGAAWCLRGLEDRGRRPFGGAMATPSQIGSDATGREGTGEVLANTLPAGSEVNERKGTGEDGARACAPSLFVSPIGTSSARHLLLSHMAGAGPDCGICQSSGSKCDASTATFA